MNNIKTKILKNIKMSRAGLKWTNDEEKQLMDEISQGIDIDTICKNHGREIGGIKSRISMFIVNKYNDNYTIEELSDMFKINTTIIEEIIEKNESRIKNKKCNDDKISMHGEKWTDDEENKLIEELQSGLNNEWISANHKRTISSINAKIKMLILQDCVNGINHNDIAIKFNKSIEEINKILEYNSVKYDKMVNGHNSYEKDICDMKKEIKQIKYDMNRIFKILERLHIVEK